MLIKAFFPFEDISMVRCIHPNCKIRACFGNSEGKALYCKTHAPEGFWNIKNKCCIHPNCKTQACFGLLFKPKIHCGQHKLSNEYRRNNPKCLFCHEKAIYYLPNMFPEYCSNHAPKIALPLSEMQCIRCNLFYENLNREQICTYCVAIPVPIKQKEDDIKKLLDYHCIEYTSYDKPIDISCSKYRPDFVFDQNPYMTTILEIDEHQHKSYPEFCECTRMINISQELGGKNVLWIRYNPDHYVSCNPELSQYDREKILIECLQKAINSTKQLQYPYMILRLFYDSYEFPQLEELFRY